MRTLVTTGVSAITSTHPAINQPVGVARCHSHLAYSIHRQANRPDQKAQPRRAHKKGPASEPISQKLRPVPTGGRMKLEGSSEQQPDG